LLADCHQGSQALAPQLQDAKTVALAPRKPGGHTTAEATNNHIVASSRPSSVLAFLSVAMRVFTFVVVREVVKVLVRVLEFPLMLDSPLYTIILRCNTQNSITTKTM
jgi:hypothetical protein